ncbi:MAG: NAD-dependent epimerase/dehydratase [Bradyrhizobium sp.]|nr:NAD-dependent epimerase/dehydratase [Bradyrhizobium sp.]
MTRSISKQAMISAMGAVPVLADALDRGQVASAVDAARPDVIVHQLTAIGSIDTRHMERDFAATNRLRVEGTDNLLLAGKAAGVRRIVAQSHIVPYARTGNSPKTEDDAFDPVPVGGMRQNHAAMEHLEKAVLGAEWAERIVLRYGWLYGPGSAMTSGGETFEIIRKRQFPLIGSARGVWSFIHVTDAAEATVAAVEHGRPGVYNIVDEPTAVAEWLPLAARLLGAMKPWRVPRFVGRLFAGEAGVVMMTEIRGASNAKAKGELGWRPLHSSWRQGFMED